MEDNNWELKFLEYKKLGEPNKLEKTKVWETAIGLQEVDGLKTSDYLIETAKEHIEGNIDLKEAEKRINNYYKVLDSREREAKEENEEADKVSVRITEILSDNSFNFNPTELLNIHKKLFSGIYEHAGEIRNFNFSKDEWILNGDTVRYSSYEIISDSLNYDFEQEKKFSYSNLSLDEAINHLCRFTSDIWQIHPFCEGNTRTTAVFIIKYLKTFGFNINNDVFANHSWYFRNSLVRANYKNFEINVFEDLSFLKKFFYNLLTDSKYELKNRYTHINYSSNITNLIVKDCTIEEQAILNIIKSNPNTTQEEIALMVGKSLRTIKSWMNVMQKKNIIARKNGKRDAEWIIISK